MRRWILLPVLALFTAGGAQAQALGRIQGTVTSETGQPVAGVNVLIQGTGLGILTGTDGRYAIADVPAGSHEVRASLIGYGDVRRQVTVASGQTVTADFRLETRAVQLEGIVATGYGTQERRYLTGAVSSVRAQQIREIPTPNVMQSIQGRLPGVDIVSANYRPGAAMNVRIRGVRSMLATNEPLFVLDGIPMAGGIEDLNPANIESIEVLKDASATATYGARGANGVILITTRGGGAGLKTDFTYDAYYGFQRPINLVDMMTGPEFAEYKREAWRAAGRTDDDAAVFNSQELYALRNGLSTDWQREILRTGHQQNHQFGITGISGNTRFALSANFFGQDGITITQGFDRYSGAMSIDHTSGRLRVGLTANLSRSEAEIGQGDGLWGEALANNPLGQPYDTLGNGTLQFRPTSDPLRVNPLLQAEEWVQEQTRNRLFGSVFTELKLLEGLNWRMNFGPDLQDRVTGQFRGLFTTGTGGSFRDAFRREEETFAYTLDNLLQLNRDFGESHHLESTLLYSIQKERYEDTRAEARNLPYDHQLWYNLGSGETLPPSSTLREWALQSFMGRVNYALQSRYLVTLTGRFDGSSRLAEGNKWAFFPSIGLGWQLGDEPFMQSLGFISSMKLRGSYGKTGNTGIDPYQTQGTLTRTRYNFGGSPAFGFRPGAIANPELEWEKTSQYDVGLEFGVFNNRVTATVDLYRAETDDLLMLRTLPPTSGFSNVVQNIGKTRNSGIELQLSSINLNNWKGLSWTTDMNWTHNKNEIVRLGEPFADSLDDVLNRWFIGQPIHVGGNDNNRQDRLRAVFFDYKFLGIWQLNEAEEAARFGRVPGEIKVADLNNDGVINADDRMIIGSTYPKWTGSIYNRFTWKSFDLSALATARVGYMLNDAFGTTNNNLYGRYGNLSVDYWTPDNPSNTNPRPSAGREDPPFNSSRAYRTGSHTRIRNITLGYALPQSLTSRIGASSLRIYGAAQEPFVFTSYYGYDPENGDFGSPPSYRTLLIGTNLTF
jgi:TonB-linked SusC/RagA family outer membrane protein